MATLKEVALPKSIYGFSALWERLGKTNSGALGPEGAGA